MENFDVNQVSLVSGADTGTLTKLWPTVKEGLTLLSTVIDNQKAKIAIKVIIGIGDLILKGES